MKYLEMDDLKSFMGLVNCSKGVYLTFAIAPAVFPRYFIF
jgi:hypothetical protein